MMPELRRELNLPACVWSQAEDKIVVGQPPSSRDKVAIVYDACITGNGIRQATKHLSSELHANVVAAVVFFNATGKGVFIDKNSNLPVLSLADSVETISVGLASKPQEGGEGSPAQQSAAAPLAPDKEGVELPKEEPMPKSIQSSRLFLTLLLRSVPLFAATACVAVLLLRDVTFQSGLMLVLAQVILSSAGIVGLFRLTRP